MIEHASSPAFHLCLRSRYTRLFCIIRLFLLFCPLLLATDENDDLVFYEFFTDGDGSYIHYTDPYYKEELRVDVPDFFIDYSGERIQDELDFYFENEGIWSERVLLETFYHSIKPKHEPHEFGGLTDWLSDTVPICNWAGITCGPLEDTSIQSRLLKDDSTAPPDAVTRIELTGMNLQGTLPPELSLLDYLQHLNLNNNELHGTIPTEFGEFLRLRFIDIGNNELSGKLPTALGRLSHSLEELWIEKNQLGGPLDYHLMELRKLRFLDLSENNLTGTIPPEIGQLASIGSIFLEENKFSGTLVSELGHLTTLRVMDLGVNDFTGPIPAEVGLCTNLVDFNVASNRLNGSLPIEFFRLSNLEVLMLGENEFSGSLPDGDDIVPSRTKEKKKYGFKWANFKGMEALAVDRNNLMGMLPPGLLYGLAPSLTSLDIGFNFFTGTLPPELGRMSHLKRFTAPFNFFGGQVPSEIGIMKELVEVNLTANVLTGTIPKVVCENAQVLDKSIIEAYGCDATLCSAGTFHPEGAASFLGACQPCPKTKIAETFSPPLSIVLGRSSCESTTYLFGDTDADGTISPGEVLRLLYSQTTGQNWGTKYQSSWRNLKLHECELEGVSCIGGKITKIDLTDANLCSNGKGNEGSAGNCEGLPVELVHLSDSLEELLLPRQRFLRGTLPSELGELTQLQSLDLQGCPLLTGTIPSELGNLAKLKYLDISECNLNGTIPTELFRLTSLEKLNLSTNPFTGTLPSEIGNLKHAKEIKLSRGFLNGTLPATIGSLSKIENLELYGNSISGSIPDEMGKCTKLMRLDMFNNNLSGQMPDSLGNMIQLRILHVKKNKLTGTIPSSLGGLEYLTSVDASLNMLSGTIPASLGSRNLLEDLRLHDNRLYDPIPQSLCTHSIVNGGRTAKHGCDAVLCPLGTFSEHGFAIDSSIGCKKCPQGQTTIYLGSTECVKLDQKDILSMLFDVLDGDKWPDEFKRGWKDESTSVCQWAGVTCDKEHAIVGLKFPGPT